VCYRGPDVAIRSPALLVQTGEVQMKAEYLQSLRYSKMNFVAVMNQDSRLSKYLELNRN
jgi:hypothetical protein